MLCLCRPNKRNKDNNDEIYDNDNNGLVLMPSIVVVC